MRVDSVFSACVCLSILTGLAAAQEHPQQEFPVAPARRLWALDASDGRSHRIEALAVGRSGRAEAIYVVERVSDVLVAGAEKPPQGEFVLWKLSGGGQVLHKDIIGKMADLGPARVTIVPLAAPHEGAAIVGLFADQYRWSLLRVDGAGRIVNRAELVKQVPDAFFSAVASHDGSGLLLAGGRNLVGNVWKVDFDGKPIWQKTYDYRTIGGVKLAPDAKTSGMFSSVAASGEAGGFVAAGDFGELNKFGIGSRSLWLARSDAGGNVISQQAFPGRFPSIAGLGKGEFVVQYDAGAGFEFDGRLRVIDAELKAKWESKIAFTTMHVDRPSLAATRSGKGFVLAGANLVLMADNSAPQSECLFFEYDAGGRVVSTASMPLAARTMVQAHVACGESRAFVGFQTKGRTPLEVSEAAVYAVSLRKGSP